MDRMKEYGQKVLKWRNTLSVLPDNQFFDLMRVYLGEIKTPYNKQNLIEQLSAFIRKEENKKTLLKLLSDTDIFIITAIMKLPVATQEKLVDFFKDAFSFANLFERLMNLEERLIIYKVKDEISGKIIFQVNPILENDFEKIINIKILLPESKDYVPIANGKIISSQFIAAFFNFIFMHSNMCKLDGSIKKKAEALLLQVFHQEKDMQLFHLLLKSFENLNLFRNCDGDFKPSLERWENFSKLSEIEQCCYLCAATTMLSRQELFRRSQLIFDILKKMQGKAYEKSVLFRLAFLENEKTLNIINDEPSKKSTVFSGGRFASLINQQVAKDVAKDDAKEKTNVAKKNETIDIPDSKIFLEKLIATALFFGLLKKTRSSVDGAEIFIPQNFNEFSSGKIERFANVDSGFNVTIMHGGSLEKLLGIIKCLELKNVDTVTTYEINRTSCLHGFDNGMTPEKLFKNFQQVLMHPIPQSLKDSVEEWFKTYNSASLYKGFVLQVAQEKQLLVENNPIIKDYIKIVLAPGIYLMDFEDEETAHSIIEKSNLDFIGEIKTIKTSNMVLPFQKLQNKDCEESKEIDCELKTDNEKESEKELNSEKENVCEKILSSETERKEFFENMRKELSLLNLPQEQTEGLQLRIQRKIVLNPSQLIGQSVRHEKYEARGMDFQGKIHIIEHAITNGNMIELIYDDANSEDGKKSIVGNPIAIEKQVGDNFIKLRIEPSQEIQVFSIGQARTVKRIRFSIFRQ